VLAAPLALALHHGHDLAERLAIEALFDEVQRTGKVVKNLPPDDREIRQLHAEEVLRRPLHQLDQQPTRLTGTLYGSGCEERHHRNRLLTGPPRICPHDSAAWREAQRRAGGDRSPSPKADTPSPVTRVQRFDVAVASRKAHVRPTAAPKVKLTFHLAPGSPVEDAPSIGPRNAARLEKTGIITIGDLLETDADGLATAVRCRDITADRVRQWQREAALVCRVPGLSGPAAQLLVACGIVEPEELAACAPEELLEKIGSFLASPEGQQSPPSEQTPSLPTVAQWIERASHIQPSRAA
jgi:predicted flap endonuclease-1-like 5' DNA nuclease